MENKIETNSSNKYQECEYLIQFFINFQILNQIQTLNNSENKDG